MHSGLIYQLHKVSTFILELRVVLQTFIATLDSRGTLEKNMTYINWRHFVEEKNTRNNNFHVVIGTNDSFIDL